MFQDLWFQALNFYIGFRLRLRFVGFRFQLMFRIVGFVIQSFRFLALCIHRLEVRGLYVLCQEFQFHASGSQIVGFQLFKFWCCRLQGLIQVLDSQFLGFRLVLQAFRFSVCSFQVQIPVQVQSSCNVAPIQLHSSSFIALLQLQCSSNIALTQLIYSSWPPLLAVLGLSWLLLGRS